MGAAAVIPALSLGLGAVSMFSSQSAAKAQAAAQTAQFQHQEAATIAEANRQEGEVKRIGTEQISDRMRVANEQLGAVRVSAGERGVSTSTMQSFARSVGFLEGLDIGRIRTQAARNISAAEATKKNAKVGVMDQLNIVENQKNVSMTSSTLNFIGSGLQIASGVYAHNQALDAAQNLKA